MSRVLRTGAGLLWDYAPNVNARPYGDLRHGTVDAPMHSAGLSMQSSSLLHLEACSGVERAWTSALALAEPSHELRADMRCGLSVGRVTVGADVSPQAGRHVEGIAADEHLRAG